MKNLSPCTKDCQRRSAECRKSCLAFIQYDLARIARQERKEAEINRRLNGSNFTYAKVRMLRKDKK